ncbi:MAG: hypothetical protein HFH18_10460 [Ruminococcus sp.]|jgi:hypothetical protein|nr:hypothetical protein [Ruminococcus sp.]
MSDKMKKTPGEQLAWNYPQLILSPETGLKETAEYKDIVLRGKLPGECACPFVTSEEDSFQEMDTPAGKAEVYFLHHRGSFERAVQILAYRGEPCPLPASMGAVTIRGLNNWRKIYARKAEYLAAGNTDWNAEFRRFTQTADNYKDTIILLSGGYYSAVSPEEAGFPEEDWKRYSRIIRTWHELAHVVSRRMYPDHQEPIRDEAVADCIGLIAAFGTYDLRLAELFLGITEEGYRAGGRLENYISNPAADREVTQGLLERTRRIMGELKKAVDAFDGREPFSCLQMIEEGRVGI